MAFRINDFASDWSDLLTAYSNNNPHFSLSGQVLNSNNEPVIQITREAIDSLKFPKKIILRQNEIGDLCSQLIQRKEDIHSKTLKKMKS